MAGEWAKGDYALCVNNKAYQQWVEWYMDDKYCEDMLEHGKTYIVQGVLNRDGYTGLNVGIPTPWGEDFWDANRFIKTLLAPVTKVRAVHA